MTSFGSKFAAGMAGLALAGEPSVRASEPEAPSPPPPVPALVDERSTLERVMGSEGLLLPPRPAGPGWQLGAFELKTDPLLNQPFRNLSLESDSVLVRRFPGGSFQLAAARSFELEPDRRGQPQSAHLLMDVGGDGRGAFVDHGKIYFRAPRGHFNVRLERGQAAAFDALYRTDDGGTLFLSGTSDNWQARIEGLQGAAMLAVQGKQFTFEGRYLDDRAELAVRASSLAGFGWEGRARFGSGGLLGVNVESERLSLDAVRAALSYEHNELRLDVGARLEGGKVDALTILISGRW